MRVITMVVVMIMVSVMGMCMDGPVRRYMCSTAEYISMLMDSTLHVHMLEGR